MEAITNVVSRTVVLPAENIDTDQIIPARFLTGTARAGLSEHLFADWRYDENGAPRPEFILNQHASRHDTVLVAGRNFGCGSSREHAPWVLYDWGFRAVISSAIADIFRNNALKIGLLPVIVDEATNRWLLSHPGTRVRIDLETTTLHVSEQRRVKFDLEPFARRCLMAGIDELDFIFSHQQVISQFEQRNQRLWSAAGDSNDGTGGQL